MALPDTFISCDWGLSNFRLRLVDLFSLQITRQLKTSKGIKSFSDRPPTPGGQRRRELETYLFAQVKELLKEDFAGECHVVASGMVSSALGITELPYATMPLPIDGSGLVIHQSATNEGLSLTLISGAMSGENLMRGEEVQALGILDELGHAESGILILPGTHSKHIEFDQSSLLRFETYLTGELFEVLGRHSLLSNSVKEAEWAPGVEDSFVLGVKSGAEGNLNRALFSVRARDLLGKSTPELNFHYLSGLLIGSELGQLIHSKQTIYLAANPRLTPPYRRALEALMPSRNFRCLSPELMEKGQLSGQKKALMSTA